MEQIIVSVPYSGTRFIQERLNIAARVHTNNIEWEDLLDIIRNRRIVVPLRSPLANWLSTEKRYDTRPLTIANIAEWYDAWHKLHALSVSRPVDFICIEDQSDKRITDWSAVGHMDKPIYKYPIPPLNFIYQLPFVKRFYSLKKDKQLWWSDQAQWMT